MSFDDDHIDAEPDVIDLRDGTHAARRAPSGRPADLMDGHRLVTITGGDAWMQAEAFVYDIYRQIGYCDESPLHRVEELARWNDQSRFHAVVDTSDEIIGIVRTISGTYAELPVGSFERTDHRHADPVCELSSLTVRTDVRSTGVIEHLYRAGWLQALRSGATSIVALIDDWLLEVFQQTYRLPFEVVGIGKDYMGTAPMPVAMALDGPGYWATARENPAFWAWTLEELTDDEVSERGFPPESALDLGAPVPRPPRTTPDP